MDSVLDGLSVVLGISLLAVGFGFAGAYVRQLIDPPSIWEREAVARALRDAQESAERALTSPWNRPPDET